MFPWSATEAEGGEAVILKTSDSAEGPQAYLIFIPFFFLDRGSGLDPLKSDR